MSACISHVSTCTLKDARILKREVHIKLVPALSILKSREATVRLTTSKAICSSITYCALFVEETIYYQNIWITKYKNVLFTALLNLSCASKFQYVCRIISNASIRLLRLSLNNYH